MLQCILRLDSVLGVFVKQLQDEVLAEQTHLVPLAAREDHWAVGYLVLYVLQAERERATQHLVEYDPNAPHVHGAAVTNVLNDLWGHVALGANVGLEVLGAILGVGAQAEVNDLWLAILVDDDVLRL